HQRVAQKVWNGDEVPGVTAMLRAFSRARGRSHGFRNRRGLRCELYAAVRRLLNLPATPPDHFNFLQRFGFARAREASEDARDLDVPMAGSDGPYSRSRCAEAGL